MILNLVVSGILVSGVALGRPVVAQTHGETGSAITLAANHTGDMVLTGGARGDGRVRYLDGMRLLGRHGMTGRVNLLDNWGGTPNDGALTLQGIDNIEVAERRVRLYEAWVEQRIGTAGHSLRLGLHDINSEFYASPAARWLVMPAFGIGPELAASGPNGPSTYPLTAPGVRGRAAIGKRGDHDMAAAVNAEVGLLDGWQNLRNSGRRSGLVVDEAGITGERAKIAIGAWFYTRRRPVFPPPGIIADGTTACANGGYVFAQYRVSGGEARRPAVHVFGRVGIADGQTTPFGGGRQWGALIESPFAGPPDGALSFGINIGRITDAHRTVPIGTPRPPRAETGPEVTYADRIAPFLTIQPDLQYVFTPAAAADRPPVIVALLRTRIEWSHP